jgi:hypothetical protein
MNRRDFLMASPFGVLGTRFFRQTPAIPRGLMVVEHKKMPAFSLPDPDGKTVRSGDFLGNALILRFWATW